MPAEPSIAYPVPFLGYMEVAEVVASDAPGFRPRRPRRHHLRPQDRPYRRPGPRARSSPCPTTSTRCSGSSSRRWVRSPPTASSTPTPKRSAARACPSAPASPAARSSSGAAAPSACSPRSSPAAPAPRSWSPSPPPAAASIAGRLGLEALPEDEAWSEAKRRWHGPDGRGADIVFQTRARADSLDRALSALRPQGTVIDLAFYQGGADALRLGEAFHHNGLSHPLRPDRAASRAASRALWDRRRLAAETVALLRAEGEAIRRHLVTHVVPFDEAADFLRRLPVERPDFLQVVFAR